MPEPPDDPDESAPPVGEIRFSADFEPNTLIYDAYTSSPPRLLEPEPAAAPPDAPSAGPGILGRVAHFRILGKIGEGGMGVVYRATDEYLQRLVALTVLNAGKSAAVDVENTQRLLREARAASRISHPNVVTVFAAGEEDGYSFIAMEYVEGQELGKLIGSDGLDVERALEIGAQIGEGLGAAHDQGIVHRDIKPANVLVCEGDRIKILDFGLAKPGGVRNLAGTPLPRKTADLPETADALDFYNTQAGVIWGSLRYMSPEQFSGDAVDARSDVFSLGVVLYQMLTGKLPFAAKSPREQLAALLRHAPAPLRQFRMRIPDAVQAIVDRALARDRDQRYVSGNALASDLRTALRRIREFGDLEIEDAAGPKIAPAMRRAPAPAAPQEPRQLAVGPDSLTYVPPGSQFDAVIVSPHVYPWAPRGSRQAGGAASGTAVNLFGETYEVLAADQQRIDLNRYFLGRWAAHSIIRRVFDYTPEVVEEYTAVTRNRGTDGAGNPLGSVLNNLFGKRRS
jgi:serine/threonine protein kinase